MLIALGRRNSESGIAHLLALVLVAVLCTLLIVVLVQSEGSAPRGRHAAPLQPRQPPIAVDAVAHRLGAEIVEIDATLGSGGRSTGTGMVLTPSGEVLTNNHVIASALAITVRAPGGRSFPAKVIGDDIENDVAVLQLDGASGLSIIAVGRVGALAVGRPLVVLNGNQAVEASVRSLGRDVTAGTSGDPNGIETRRGVIELGVPMQPVDAGGPVADGQGAIVAMRTAASAGRLFNEERGGDVSFATPIDRALAIVGQVNAGRSAGTVHVGPSAALGVDVSGTTNGAGLTVTAVQPGRPAAAAGIAAQDVLASVDETSLASPVDLEAVLNRHAPGDAVRVGWFDGSGVYHTASVRLVEGAPA
jgi:S1-C subfamily serine protease